MQEWQPQPLTYNQGKIMNNSATPKTITRGNGNIKARVECGKYNDELLTIKDDFQWTVQPLNPELARLTILVLTEYLEVRV